MVGAAGQEFEYKMMSKKGLLKFVKYTLIFSNAFGFILSIFLGLFGIAYPDKHFPLSYKGREMALCSLFCMLFTTIGYCGAQNHRRILLIIYGATNVIIVIIFVILWFLFKENSILGNKEISNMFITTLAITIAVMSLFACILAVHIQTFKDDAQDSIVSQSHQLLQQTTAFLQQQQQHQMQQQAAAAAAAAAAGHLGNPLDAGGGGGMGVGGPNPGGGGAGSTFGGLAGPAPALHHQTQLPPPHHPMHQHQHLQHHQQQQQQQQQDMMMLGHHHNTGASQSRPLLMQGQAIQMTHIKSASQRNKSTAANALKGPGGQLMMPPNAGGASTSGHQLALMRNQSSPLPGVATAPGPPSHQLASNYQTTGRGPKQQQHQQIYSQSQKHQQRGHPPEPPSPPSPPPPPPPPPQQAPNHVPPSNQQAQNQAPPPPPSSHHHSQHHHSLRQAGTARMPPTCPVQYCTFDCDRTV